MADFIPKQHKKAPVTIQVDFEKLKIIEKTAYDYNLSRSEFINQCIEFALKNMVTDKNKHK